MPTTQLFDNGLITAPILQSPNKLLVYVPTLKCASSYYANVFLNHNWTPIGSEDLDFNKQTVFGFLIHPTKRYAKGAATDLFEVGIENIIMTFVGARFWEYPPILGVHTLPITLVYKDIFRQMKWIPLDVQNVNANTELVNLCKINNEEISMPTEMINVSTDHQKKIYETIEKNIAGAGESWYNMLYPDELKLYNECKKYYESRAKSDH